MEIGERQLASIKKITGLDPIKGADRIECATIAGGWRTIVNKGDFRVGYWCLYIEIDAWVPHKLAPFLSKGSEPREFRGVKGERLRTITLKGQLSQGLALSLGDIPSEYLSVAHSTVHALEFWVGDKPFSGVERAGYTLDTWFGIQKWEMALPARLGGQVAGGFPGLLQKTDQERVQNLAGEIDWGEEYQITTKLDGTSMTMWIDGGVLRVFSRNLELKVDQKGNSLVDCALSLIGDIDISSNKEPINYAIQGELMGPGIQGNREGLSRHMFYVFDIWDVNRQSYVSSCYTERCCAQLRLDNDPLIPLSHVPILHQRSKLCDLGITSVDSALEFAEGESMRNPVREGVVFKRCNGDRFTFKAINNNFLVRSK